jgi:hypothetical protein
VIQIQATGWSPVRIPPAATPRLGPASAPAPAPACPLWIGRRPAVVMRVGAGQWRPLRLMVVASAAGTWVHIALAPVVKAVGPPPVPARPPGRLVSLGAAAPSPPRVLVVLVSLPGGSWGRRSGGLRAGDCGVTRILPCPEKVVGDDALSDQVVCGKAAGLEQDRTAGGGARGNVLVAAAPLLRGRAALVVWRRRSAEVMSSSRGRGVAAASAGPRLH